MIVYLAVFLLALASAGLMIIAFRPSKRQEKVSLALERLDAYDVRSFRKAELSQPASQRILAPAGARLASVARFITPRGRITRLQEKVERAGRPWSLDLNGLLAVKVASLLVGLLVLIVVAGVRVLPAGWVLPLGVVILVGAYYTPDALLYSWISGRQRRISRALPDLIDLLTVAGAAGLGLDAALARIAEKIKDPLREEILITLHHMRIGQSREAALREFAKRCGVKDLGTFVSAVIQSQRLGVSLGRILRVQSDSLRVTRRQRVQETAQKAPIKLIFPLILCIFPALFVVIVGPAAIRIYDAVLNGVFGR